MFNVYILKSDSKKKIYIGHTGRFPERGLEHVIGKSKSTQFANDWKVVHQEEYETRSLAMKREKFLKSGDGKRVLKLKGIS